MKRLSINIHTIGEACPFLVPIILRLSNCLAMMVLVMIRGWFFTRK